MTMRSVLLVATMVAGCGGGSATTDAAAADAPPDGRATDMAPTIDADPTPAITLASWDATRGGVYYSAGGTAFAKARASVEGEFDVTWVELSSLTGLASSGAAGVILSVVYDAAPTAVTALTTEEQAALSAFVQGGGFAILQIDNDTSFAASNSSLLAPVGLTAGGTLMADSTGTVTGSHPVTAGVSTFAVIWPGNVSDPGSAGTTLATTPIGPLIVIRERDAIATGSGVVLVYADTLWFDGVTSLDTDTHRTLLTQGIHHASGL